MVKERAKRQRYQAMYKRSVDEVLELRHQLSTRWESNDEERARMELEYDAFVVSDRVGDEGVSPTNVTPLMSSESSRDATHLSVRGVSVDLSDPGVCEVVGDEGEEEEEVEAAPTVSKKRKSPPCGYFLESGGSTEGKSMEY